MTGRIYRLDDHDSNLLPMDEAPYDSEKLLQELLAAYPDLLAGEQINTDEPRRWVLVTREMSVPGDQEGSGKWSLDHLFLDQDAIPTLVEVKKGTNSDIRRKVIGQMLDYAANAVAYWPVEEIQARFRSRCDKENIDANAALAELLGEQGIDPIDFWQQVKINLQAGRIRMVFIADKIPTELRRIVEFLNAQMDPAEVLAIEIKQFVGEGVKTLVPRVLGQTESAQDKKHPSRGKQWTDWDSALADISNPAVISFFQQELKSNRESNLGKRFLRYRLSDKPRWFVTARQKYAYVWQRGRFAGDIEFWHNGLSQSAEIKPVDDDSCLRFSLYEPEDFEFFYTTAMQSPKSIQWQTNAADDEIEPQD